MAPYKDWPAIGITASLYIHVPFCAGKCDYCDFYSLVPAKDDAGHLMDTFISALLADVEDQISFFDVTRVPTIYIGGGTPSVLGAGRLDRLLGGIRSMRPCSRSPECTVEANPESMDERFLEVCRNHKVTRISLGVQTFHEPSRQAVHRVGAGKLLKKRLALAARYYPRAFSVDIITGLPFQSPVGLLEDIDLVLDFEPGHVSIYSLTTEPGTPLAEDPRFRDILPDDDEADFLWLVGRDTLERAGFKQYEVSNFAGPGKSCAHNIRYWRMENWLGAGPAASGTIIDDNSGTGRRYTYPKDIAAYLDAPRPLIRTAAIPEKLDRRVLICETVLMGFRYYEGPDTELFRRRFGCNIEDCIPDTVTRWRERGFFAGRKAAGNRLAPSRVGMLFLNGFLRDAFDELEAKMQKEK